MIPPNLPPALPLEPSLRRILKPKRTLASEEIEEDIEEKVNRLITEGHFQEAFNTIASIPFEPVRTELTKKVNYKFLEKDHFDYANQLIGLMNPRHHFILIYAAGLSCLSQGKLGPAYAYYKALIFSEAKLSLFKQILSKYQYKEQLIAQTLKELVFENKIEEAIQIATLAPHPENELFDIGKYLIQSNLREKIPLILEKMTSRKEEFIALLNTAS